MGEAIRSRIWVLRAWVLVRLGVGFVWAFGVRVDVVVWPRVRVEVERGALKLLERGSRCCRWVVGVVENVLSWNDEVL